MSFPENEAAISADERSPLLTRTSEPSRSGHERTHIPHIPTLHSSRTVLWALVGIILVIVFGGELQTIPQTRLIEDVLCHIHYDSLSGSSHIGLTQKIDEELCKGDDIQEQLAYVGGILDMLNAVPSFFCAIPYGILADKIGRRPIMFLSMIGMLLSNLGVIVVLYWWHIFPLHLIFLTPVVSLIGGGNAVLVSMINAVVADVSTEEARAVNFLFVGAGSILSNIVGPASSGYLMNISTPWLPMIAGFILSTFGAFLCLLLPETTHFAKASSNLTPTTTRSKGAQKKTLVSKITTELRHMFKEAKEVSSVIKTPSMVLLLLTFMTHFWNGSAERFSPLYVSKRFHWHLSETTYLMSLIAIINVFLLLLILPSLSRLLSSPTSLLPARYRLHTAQKDLWLARASIIAAAIGALLIAGPTVHFVILGLMVFTLGHGFTMLVRSVITSMVDEQHVARLYSCITIIDTLGAVAAGPALPWLFGVGLRFGREKHGGDAWLGLPYLGTSAVCVIAGIAVFSARLPLRKMEREVEVEVEHVDV